MKRILVVGMILGLAFAWMGCSDDDCPVCKQEPAVTTQLAKSLHNSTKGMEYFYAAAQGGIEQFTNVPYDQLDCRSACHVEATEDACSVCHISETSAPRDDACFVCHGRQGLEVQLQYSDVHRDMGWQCVNCHSSADAHGDGTVYVSAQEEGAIDVRCEQCHTTLSSNAAHSQHAQGFECAVCHTQSVVSCYSCHLDDDLAGNGKLFPNPPMHDWKFLVKNDQGKVDTANIMGITYNGQTFYSLAPYFAHTVYTPDPDTICDECHANAIVDEYNNSGTMTAVWWDDQEGALQNFKGVIPVPSDYQTALKLSYATTNDIGQTWTKLKDGSDLIQMLFAQPLDNLPIQFGKRATAH